MDAYERHRNDPGSCPSCWGSGKVGNDDEQAPWPAWEELPPPSNMAVVIGMVRPMACPNCDGTGRITATPEAEDVLVGTVPVPDSPMTPEGLAAEVAEIVHMAQERVGPGSIGATQYHVDGQPQKFETMDLTGLADYLLEEALDLINYGVMMSIRARRIRNAAIEARHREVTSGK